MPTALIFDVFGTLLHFKDDERPEHPWEVLAEHLNAAGAHTDAASVRRARTVIVDAHFAVAAAVHPDVDMHLVYRELIDELVPGHPRPEELADEAAWVFRAAATEYRSAYPGAHDALTRLSGAHRLAIASNTQRCYTTRELAAEQLDNHFEVITFSSDVGRVKPEPLLLERTLSDLGVAASDALYIGDNPLDDYVAATAAGIPIVLIRHDGLTDPAELGVPRSVPIATGFEHLLEIIGGRR